MPYPARRSEASGGDNHPQSPTATAARGDPELAAIALLCLMFAWPTDERKAPEQRSVWR